MRYQKGKTVIEGSELYVFIIVILKIVLGFILAVLALYSFGAIGIFNYIVH
jgi:hypothetical protein